MLYSSSGSSIDTLAFTSYSVFTTEFYRYKKRLAPVSVAARPRVSPAIATIPVTPPVVPFVISSVIPPVVPKITPPAVSAIAATLVPPIPAAVPSSVIVTAVTVVPGAAAVIPAVVRPVFSAAAATRLPNHIRGVHTLAFLRAGIFAS